MTTNLGVRAKRGGGTVTRCAIELGEGSLKILQLGIVLEVKSWVSFGILMQKVPEAEQHNDTGVFMI